MLIQFSDLCSKYGISPKGIIHVGACQLEEIEDYKSQGINNVVWIEGNPDLVKLNSERAKSEGHILIEGLVYDIDDLEVEFNITNNSQSSSILDFKKHSEYHPHVVVEKTIKLKTKTLQTLLEKNKIDLFSFDFLNLDIQGIELRALKGMGEYLENIKYIYTEINSGEVYKGNDMLEDIDIFLGDLGFKRVETEMTPFEWGDAFYIK